MRRSKKGPANQGLPVQPQDGLPQPECRRPPGFTVASGPELPAAKPVFRPSFRRHHLVDALLKAKLKDTHRHSPGGPTAMMVNDRNYGDFLTKQAKSDNRLEDCCRRRARPSSAQGPRAAVRTIVVITSASKQAPPTTFSVDPSASRTRSSSCGHPPKVPRPSNAHASSATNKPSGGHTRRHSDLAGRRPRDAQGPHVPRPPPLPPQLQPDGKALAISPASPLGGPRLSSRSSARSPSASATGSFSSGTGTSSGGRPASASTGTRPERPMSALSLRRGQRPTSSPTVKGGRREVALEDDDSVVSLGKKNIDRLIRSLAKLAAAPSPYHHPTPPAAEAEGMQGSMDEALESRQRALSMTTPELLAYKAAVDRRRSDDWPLRMLARPASAKSPTSRESVQVACVIPRPRSASAARHHRNTRSSSVSSPRSLGAGSTPPRRRGGPSPSAPFRTRFNAREQKLLGGGASRARRPTAGGVEEESELSAGSDADEEEDVEEEVVEWNEEAGVESAAAAAGLPRAGHGAATSSSSEGQQEEEEGGEAPVPFESAEEPQPGMWYWKPDVGVVVPAGVQAGREQAGEEGEEAPLGTCETRSGDASEAGSGGGAREAVETGEEGGSSHAAHSEAAAEEEEEGSVVRGTGSACSSTRAAEGAGWEGDAVVAAAEQAAREAGQEPVGEAEGEGAVRGRGGVDEAKDDGQQKRRRKSKRVLKKRRPSALGEGPAVRSLIISPPVKPRKKGMVMEAIRGGSDSSNGKGRRRGGAEGGRQDTAVTQMTTGEPNSTNVRYWDAFAHTWSEEIMDSIKEDRTRIILQRLSEYCDRSSTVAVDFGCGVGRYLPHLSTRCDRVLALDISAPLVQQARALCQRDHFNNVQLEVLDFGAREWERAGGSSSSSSSPHGCPSQLLTPGCANVAVCANVLISPEPLTRRAILSNIATTLCTGGYLILLVPAIESALMVRRRHSEWQEYRRARKLKSLGDREKLEESCAADERLGVFRREGVQTKHFRAADLEPLLRLSGFKLLSLDRVEYDWSTELHPPTGWMKSPRPWDWLAVARKSTLLQKNRLVATTGGGGGSGGQAVGLLAREEAAAVVAGKS